MLAASQQLSTHAVLLQGSGCNMHSMQGVSEEYSLPTTRSHNQLTAYTLNNHN
jgi:hypothetical protein